MEQGVALILSCRQHLKRTAGYSEGTLFPASAEHLITAGVEVTGVKKEPLQQVSQTWILTSEQNILEQSRDQEGFSGERPKVVSWTRQERTEQTAKGAGCRVLLAHETKPEHW